MSDLAEEPTLVEGPGWAPHDLLDVRGGLFPLSVENHVIATIAKLPSGATTVTTLARYYSLHTFMATVAEERGLEGSDAIGLLRRAEIVVAGTTIAAGIGPGDERPHGYDTISRLWTLLVSFRSPTSRDDLAATQTTEVGPLLPTSAARTRPP